MTPLFSCLHAELQEVIREGRERGYCVELNLKPKRHTFACTQSTSHTPYANDTKLHLSLIVSPQTRILDLQNKNLLAESIDIEYPVTIAL